MNSIPRRLWILTLALLLAGCETAQERMFVRYDNVRTWKARYLIPPDKLLSLAKMGLESAPLSLVVSTAGPTKLETQMSFLGRYEGIWPFGSHWDNRFTIAVEVLEATEQEKSELTLTALLTERPNSNWDWRRAENFGSAESEFEKIVHALKASIEGK